MTTAERRPLVIHVGCSKTGTSSLQAGLWQSVPALAEAGVGIPLPGRSAHLAGLLRPLGWRAVDGFAHPWSEPALKRLVDRLRETPGERLLLSNEDLAEVTAGGAVRIAEIADRAGLDVHLVLTVRDWALQLPSEYQQFLKHGMTLTYDEFLAEVRDRSGRWGDQFRRRQDPVDILDRWAAAAPADRVTVVVVPPYASDPDGVFRLMGEAAGFDASLIARPDHAVNSSFGVVEAEVFRRVNAALRPPLAGYSDVYARAIRWPFVKGVLAKKASQRIPLPIEHLGWVREEATSMVEGLTSRGAGVLGDPARLVPGDDAARPMPAIDEAEVAAAAIKALARYAERQAAVERRAAEERQKAAAERPEPAPAPARRGLRERLRRSR